MTPPKRGSLSKKRLPDCERSPLIRGDFTLMLTHSCVIRVVTLGSTNIPEAHKQLNRSIRSRSCADACRIKR